MYTIHQRNYLRPGHCRIIADRFDHSTDCDAHDHDMFEIALVIRGRCVHDSALGCQPVGVGNAIILRPGAWHAMRQTEDLVMFNCLFAANLLTSRLKWALEESVPRRLLRDDLDPHGILSLRLPPGGAARCESLFNRFPRLTDPDPTSSEYEAIATLLLALAELSRGVPISAAQPGNLAADPTHPAVAKAAKLLRAQPARRWSVDELADMVGLSGPYLVRRFASEMGVSPIAYLARQRAEYAAAELIRSNKPVLEIGIDAGWPEPKHFARRFKEHFGITATEYRTRFSRGT